ncbi:MAG: eight-cysteine-cluster domain-containing protein [Candidatus Micrarchaeota archaeon]|nr:eight-cysteine-cluster domain-containing protein [Candidatus Micrarchaeota archaeon]
MKKILLFIFSILFFSGCLQVQESKQPVSLNPAEKKCIEDGASYQILESNSQKIGVCIFPNNAKCEQWAYFRGECNSTHPNFCMEDFDCDCGKNKITNQCFFGQRDFVDPSKQCPDFCTGFAGQLEPKCINFSCQLVQRQNQPQEPFCGFSQGKCSKDSDCLVGGCSGQVCYSKDIEAPITTCEYRECYNAAKYGLGCKCADGFCKWT